MQGDILYKATIPLIPITKKNHQRIAVNKQTGKPFIIQAEKYKEYENNCGWFLRGSPNISEPVNIQMIFYKPTKRSCDLSNHQSACLDILVKYQIIADDNDSIVKGHDGSRVLYDKDNPRTEILITKFRE